MSNEPLRQKVAQAISESLGEAYDCDRTWSAWSYGTMRQDDFSLVGENQERCFELADAARAAIAKAEGGAQ